jgi:branched-chain amino acid aminotransferase
VFLVTQGRLLTPSLASGCLPGITRELVIGLAARLGISCEETDLPAARVHQADEIFLTSSTRGVVGLSRFGDRELPAGRLTGDLRLAWNAEVSRECSIRAV